jgi:cold shock protein
MRSPGLILSLDERPQVRRRNKWLDFCAKRAGRMGQKGRDRSQRRRGFDDENDSGPPAYDGRSRQSFRSGPRESAAPSGPAIDAVVKWFNADKGFGFVELADQSGDAFLHVAVLEAAGHATVNPSSKLSVQVGVGKKGRQVMAVLAVDASPGADPRANARPPAKASSGRERPDPAAAISIEGTVKWFNADKGFGFVVCDDGQRDVFVHASIVESAGLRGLNEGQRLAMRVVKTQKGREAISLSLI